MFRFPKGNLLDLSKTNVPCHQPEAVLATEVLEAPGLECLHNSGVAPLKIAGSVVSGENTGQARKRKAKHPGGLQASAGFAQEDQRLGLIEMFQKVLCKAKSKVVAWKRMLAHQLTPDDLRLDGIQHNAPGIVVLEAVHIQPAVDEILSAPVLNPVEFQRVDCVFLHFRGGPATWMSVKWQGETAFRRHRGTGPLLMRRYRRLGGRR